MSGNNKPKLAKQLAVVLILVMLAVQLIVSVYKYNTHITNLKNTNLNNALAISQAINSAITEDIYADNYSSIEHKILNFSKVETIDSIKLYDSLGKMILEAKRNRAEDLFLTYDYSHIEQSLLKEFVGYQADDKLTILLPIRFSGKIISWMQLLASSQFITHFKSKFIKDFIYLNLIIFLVSSMTIILFLNIKLRDLTKLVDFSKQLSLAKGEQIQLKNTVDEFNTLQRHLNLAAKEISTNQKKLIDQNVQLKQLAITDYLTQLPNRRHFDESVNKAILIANRNQTFLTLAIIDVDYFKSYNDYYGHPEGDKVLISIGKVLKSCLKRPDDQAFGVGGEEFAVIFYEQNIEKSRDFLESILTNILALKIQHERSLVSHYVTMSIGALVKQNHQTMTFSELYSGADQALYQAKKHRNKINVV